MKKVVSEDAVRRAVDKMDEEKGLAWLQSHLDYCTRPLLGEKWVLDIDTTVKLLYGHQQGAVVGYNPTKPGRPSHVIHTYMMGGVRMVLSNETMPGNQSSSAHCAPDLWALLDRLSPGEKPALLRGDSGFGNEKMMAAAEERHQDYLFKLRLSKGVRRQVERMATDSGWQDVGAGWYARESLLQLMGWSKKRRVVVMRRKVREKTVLEDRAQQSFCFVDRNEVIWEHAVLITSLPHELGAIAQMYRNRADCENVFDELKNQWGWGGFSSQSLRRSRLMTRFVALVYNWWSLFVRLADPDRAREAITSRPLLLSGVGRQTRHAGKTIVTISSSHGKQGKARRLFRALAVFFGELRNNAEQLTPLLRWYRILSRAMSFWLKGKQLRPPLVLCSP